MQRIDDDARQARRVEQALFQVEVPGAILLRHQAALQPVGKASDDALQVGELLVEIAAQAIKLLGLAQLLGRNGLVEAHRERPVVGAARLIRTIARPPRLGGGLGLAHFGIVSHVGGGRVHGLLGGLGGVGGRLGVLHAHLFHVLGIGGFALLAVFVLAPVLIALLAVLLLFG